MENFRLTHAIKSFLIALGIALSAGGKTHAADKPAKQVFGAQKTPAKGIAKSIGFYSKGCLAGAQELPMNGPNWQVMRPGRNRNWGHPALIRFLESLSRQGSEKGWPGLLVGDMSQPRGGPMPQGHTSHQIGLDADIWFTPMPEQKLSWHKRETMPFVSMLKTKTLFIDPAKWSMPRTEILKLAALDPQVERIFVHPGIKKHLCDITANDDQSWLHKIRPFWGHDSHFHVRLKCQSGSPSCWSQPPVPKGSGCDASLDWWFTDEPWFPKKQKPKTSPKVMMMSDMPHGCMVLINKTTP